MGSAQNQLKIVSMQLFDDFGSRFGRRMAHAFSPYKRISGEKCARPTALQASKLFARF